MKYSITEGLSGTKQYLSPEQMESFIGVGITSQLVMAPFISLLSWVIGAGVLFGMVKIFKGDGKFKQVLSLTGYAYIIILVYYVLSVIASFHSNNLFIDLSLLSIIKTIMPIAKGSYIYGFARSIDIFSIWQYLLIGIGVAHISRLNRAKVYTIMIIVYLASILITAFGSRYT